MIVNSTSYLLGIFSPNGDKEYIDENKWKGKIIGVEREPAIKLKHVTVYCISPFWKFKQIVQEKPLPNFGFVNECDIKIINK